MPGSTVGQGQGQGQATHLIEGCGVLAEALGQGSQEVVVACVAAPQVAGHRNDCHQGVVLEVGNGLRLRAQYHQDLRCLQSHIALCVMVEAGC